MLLSEATYRQHAAVRKGTQTYKAVTLTTAPTLPHINIKY